MNATPITALATVGLYTALNVFIMLWLASSTGTLRRKYRIAVGDGGHPHLIRILRGSANAAENIPLTLVMLLIAALVGAPVFLLHILGLLFTLGRASHAWHFIQEEAPGWQRFGGFFLSLSMTALLAIGLLVHSVWLIATA